MAEFLASFGNTVSQTAGVWVPVLTFVLGGLFQAAIAEWRTRAAEGRAKAQRHEEWGRQQKDATLTRLREAVVRDIDETRRFFVEQEAFLLARSEGRAIPYPGAKYPNLDINLVGDARVALEQVQVAAALLERTPGSGVPVDLLSRTGMLHSDVIRLLRAQEARALSNQPLVEMSEADLRSISAEQQALAAKLTGR